MPPAPELTTERFRLRTLTAADATERYLDWMRDPEVTRTLMAQRVKPTLETLRDYIAGHDGKTDFLFGIFEGDLHIGNLSVTSFAQDRRGNVGVMIGDRDYWGEAVVLEVRAAVLDFMFDSQDCLKMTAGCLSHNTPAIYNFRRQGWTLEGVRKRHYLMAGEWRDELLFAMFADDWREKRAS